MSTVRKDNRLLPAKCFVLAEAHAPIKRLLYHGSQSRQLGSCAEEWY